MVATILLLQRAKETVTETVDAAIAARFPELLAPMPVPDVDVALNVALGNAQDEAATAALIDLASDPPVAGNLELSKNNDETVLPSSQTSVETVSLISSSPLTANAVNMNHIDSGVVMGVDINDIVSVTIAYLSSDGNHSYLWNEITEDGQEPEHSSDEGF